MSQERKLRSAFIKAKRKYSNEGMIPLVRGFINYQRRLLYETLAPSYGKMSVRDPYDDIQYLIDESSPTIIDGGANKGQTIEELLPLFEDPMIHAFEPQPDLARDLEERFSVHDNINIYNIALGDENKNVELNITKDNTNSSIFEPSERVPQEVQGVSEENHHQDIHREVNNIVKVEQKKLTECVTEVDILKLDLQGYELNALKGATDILNECKLVYTELFFEEAYQDIPRYFSLEKFLRDNGFELFNYYNLHTRLAGNLSRADGIYLNKKYYKDSILSA